MSRWYGLEYGVHAILISSYPPGLIQRGLQPVGRLDTADMLAEADIMISPPDSDLTSSTVAANECPLRARLMLRH